MKTVKHWSRVLPDNACGNAVEWARKQPSAAAAWKSCERGDWMLWLAGKWCETETERKRLVLAACECARLALPHVKKGELRPLRAIETAEQWARGENGVTLGDVRAARRAAGAAYAAGAAAAYAADAAAAYAADAAAYAADAAAYAAAAAAADAADAAAADAADAAAYAAAYAAADAAARKSILSQCADIVRGHYPKPPKPARA